jgi:hypothetical protein
MILVKASAGKRAIGCFAALGAKGVLENERGRST